MTVIVVGFSRGSLLTEPTEPIESIEHIYNGRNLYIHQIIHISFSAVFGSFSAVFQSFSKRFWSVLDCLRTVLHGLNNML